MRIVWTLVKIAIGLAIAIPLGMFLITAAFGVVGAVVGLAVIAVRLACIGLVAYGAFRVFRFFAAPRRKPVAEPAVQLPAADPYYAAAMRELDAELRL